MSIYHRKPNGYYITRYKYHLQDFIQADLNRKKPSNEQTDVSAHLGASRTHSDTVILTYNGVQEVTVNRLKVSNTCDYFRVLLVGNFMESNQAKIDITIDEENFSFEIFKAVIDYANEDYFDTTKSNLGYYIDMIQLATFWLYDDLIVLLENHLCLNIDARYIISLANVAQLLDLKKLKDSCATYRKWLDQPAENYSGPMVCCSMVGHNGHHYMNCQAGLDDSNEDWDRESSCINSD